MFEASCTGLFSLNVNICLTKAIQMLTTKRVPLSVVPVLMHEVTGTIVATPNVYCDGQCSYVKSNKY